MVANRDMLTSIVIDSPSMEFIEAPPKWNKQGSPVVHQVETIQAHSFGDDNIVVVAVSNLDLNRARVVDIELPIKKASSIMLHTLKGDPRDTNLKELNVELTSSKVSADQLKSGVFQTIIPAGSPAVFVFEK